MSDGATPQQRAIVEQMRDFFRAYADHDPGHAAKADALTALLAATTDGPLVTREQLVSIEWGGTGMGNVLCPACNALPEESHAADCWIARALTASPAPSPPAGWHEGVLYCYGGCGTRYTSFQRDVILPTPLWNRIAVGAPFDEHESNIDREGRGGVLCPMCIVTRLAALKDCTVIHANIETPVPSPPDLVALRQAWEAGFTLCRSYGDNHAHFDGEQKERQWQKYVRVALSAAPPAPTPLSIEQLARAQGVKPGDAIPALFSDLSAEEFDAFLADIYRQREPAPPAPTGAPASSCEFPNKGNNICDSPWRGGVQ